MQCWFCSLREAETEYAYNFDMYGIYKFPVVLTVITDIKQQNLQK